jgi:hypothetical protein
MSGISGRCEAERFAASNLFAFLLWLRTARDKRLAGWPEVARWLEEDRAGFQDAMWDFAGVIGVKGAALSFAENVLRHAGEREVVVWRRRDGARTAFSRDRLRAEVAAFAASLRAAGIGPDDGVGGWIPDSPVGVAAFLAANAVGAVWWCSATGVPSPKLELSDTADRGAAREFARRPLSAPLAFLADGSTEEQAALLSHLCEILLRADVKPDDRVLCPAPTDGRAWIWVASLLMTGATLILAEEAASHPDPSALARIMKEEDANVLAGPFAWIERARPIGALAPGSLRFHVIGGEACEESVASPETPPLLRGLLRSGTRGG